MSQNDDDRLELAIDLAQEAGGRTSGPGGAGLTLDEALDATRVGLPPVGTGGNPAGGHEQPPAGGYGLPPAGGHGMPPAGGYGVPPAGGYGVPPAGGYGVPPAAPGMPALSHGHVDGPGMARAPGRAPGAARVRGGAGGHGGSGTAVHSFSVGEVLSQSASIYIPRLLSFALITTLAYVPAILIFGLLVMGSGEAPPPEAVAAMEGMEAVEGMEAGMGTSSTGAFVAGVAAWLLVLAGGLFSCALITGTVFRQMRGDAPSLGEMMRMGLSRIGRLAWLGVILFLAGVGFAISFAVLSMILGLLMIPLMIGLAVLIVVLQLNWWVLLPVAVVESVPIMQCFERSSSLTRGSRLQILGLAILLGIVGMGLQFLIGQANDWFGGILITLLLIAFGNFYLVVLAVSYHELRVDKEGVELGDLLQVFS